MYHSVYMIVPHTNKEHASFEHSQFDNELSIELDCRQLELRDW